MRKLLAGILVMGAVAQASELPVQVRGARALGMGDALSAAVDDQNIFFYNPAGSVQRTGPLMTFVDIPVTVSKDFVEFSKFVSDNEERLKNFDSNNPDTALIHEILTKQIKLKPTFGLGVPNTSYLSGPNGRTHWGVGVFGQATGRVGFTPDITTPSLYYDLNVDFVPMLNFAFRLDPDFLPGQLGIGLNAKYIRRGQAKDDHVSFLQLDSYDAPPLQVGHGIGADLGLLYQPTERFGFSTTFMDVGYTQLSFDAKEAQDGFSAKPAHKSGIPQRLNVGIAWTPEFFGDRLLLAADVRDLLNAKEKAFFDGGVVADSAGKHIHFGAEYRWWFLRMRAGANQGYPTFGAGVDFPLIKLDYTYFSDETGSFAGSSQHTAHMLSVAIRLGTGGTEARDRVAEGKAAAEEESEKN